MVAALAWMGTAAVARRMGVMPGTMGLAPPAYIGMWLLMMAAMMLPAVSPVAGLYRRTLTPRRPLRVAEFVGGYLLVWALAGLPAYALARGADAVARQQQPGVVRGVAVATFVGVAAYQLSPLKAACLRACRSPLGLFLRYAGYRGGCATCASGSTTASTASAAAGRCSSRWSPLGS